MGLTNQKARHRWTGHRAAVSPVVGNPQTSVGVHFSQPGHSVSDMEFLAIEKVVNTNPFILRAREQYWIRQYQSVAQGLNKEL